MKAIFPCQTHIPPSSWTRILYLSHDPIWTINSKQTYHNHNRIQNNIGRCGLKMNYTNAQLPFLGHLTARQLSVTYNTKVPKLLHKYLPIRNYKQPHGFIKQYKTLLPCFKFLKFIWPRQTMAQKKLQTTYPYITRKLSHTSTYCFGIIGPVYPYWSKDETQYFIWVNNNHTKYTFHHTHSVWK